MLLPTDIFIRINLNLCTAIIKSGARRKMPKGLKVIKMCSGKYDIYN